MTASDNSQSDNRPADVQALDAEIVRLINQRYELAQQAGGSAAGLPASDQENQLLARLDAANDGPLQADTLRAVFREILSGETALLRPVSVAYLGPEMTFSHLATTRKFGESVQTRSKQTIIDIFEDVEKDVADYGVVPVENSTEGAVTVTFDQFHQTSVKIVSELYMRIHHHVLAQGALEDIRVLYSHPQVLGQCRRWIQQNLPRCEVTPVSSTSVAAAKVAEDVGAGAVAGLLAAEKYGLNIVSRNVEDISENTTRFLVLGKHSPPPSGDDKTSILFALEDRVGALYDALYAFKTNDVNLAMIQSRPSKQRSWDYFFFVDFMGHAEDPVNRSAIAALEENCKFVKQLGSYPRSPDPV